MDSWATDYENAIIDGYTSKNILTTNCRVLALCFIIRVDLRSLVSIYGWSFSCGQYLLFTHDSYWRVGGFQF